MAVGVGVDVGVDMGGERAAGQQWRRMIETGTVAADWHDWIGTRRMKTREHFPNKLGRLSQPGMAGGRRNSGHRTRSIEQAAPQRSGD
jgi:hypothetical protein